MRKQQADNLKIFEYTAITPDNTARTILEKLSKLLDTKQKEIMITSQTLDASSSDYLENLEQQEKEKDKRYMIITISIFVAMNVIIGIISLQAFI
ncbi:MAG: hypothetical protein ACE5RC_09025 [Nitrosopumilus sp.]